MQKSVEEEKRQQTTSVKDEYDTVVTKHAEMANVLADFYQELYERKCA